MPYHVTNDPEAGAIYIQVREGEVGRTYGIRPDVLLDLRDDGELLGVEILGRHHLEQRSEKQMEAGGEAEKSLPA